MDIINIFIFTIGVYVLMKSLSKLCNWFGFGNYYTLGNVNNPFLTDSRLPLKKKVLDQKVRESILKQNFNQEKVPSNLDAIVIGSGIGGLTTAAILAKTGKKVLVLEQYDQAGGCCHTFIEKGYEFDVGILYIGEMNSQTLEKTLADQISDGQIEFADLDDDFDTIVFKEGSKVQKFPVYSNVQKEKNYLKKEFPQEELAINEFYNIIEKMHDWRHAAFIYKAVPLPLVKILNYLGITKFFTYFFELNKKSLTETVSDLTKNQTLQSIFSYCYGNYGTIPNEAAFTIHALTYNHYSKGASYPVGGASEIAYNIIPVIERAGGKVLVNAEVTNILINSEGKAYGVKMKHGSREYEFLAPIIISNAGITKTVERFLPPEVARKSFMNQIVQKLKPGFGIMSIFVGLDVPAEELDIPLNKNYWVFTQKDHDKAVIDYFEKSSEECKNYDEPMNFITFTSTKDPLWEDKFPGKTTMTIMRPANYEWFQKWEKIPASKRGDDYEEIKNPIGYKSIDVACQLFPTIKEHIDYVNIRSPLENNYYLGSSKGEAYGFQFAEKRFDIDTFVVLRPKTDIEGLFLATKDIGCCGFVAGLYGGLLCAQQVLGRYIFGDLKNLHKQIITKKED